MAFKKSAGKTAVSMPAGILLGLALSVVITLALSMVTAHLMKNEAVKDEQIGYISMFILLLSAFFGCALSAHKIKRQRLLVCALSGVSYLAVLLSTTALFFGGQYAGVGAAIIMIGIGMAGAILLGLPQGRGAVKIHKKRGYR